MPLMLPMRSLQTSKGDSKMKITFERVENGWLAERQDSPNKPVQRWVFTSYFDISNFLREFEQQVIPPEDITF